MRILWVFLLLPLALLGKEYDVQLTPSATTVRLDEPLTLTLTLHYPEGKAPSQEILVQNLIERASFSQPPFQLLTMKTIEKTSTSQTVQFELKPQLIGTHPLSFFTIPFGENDEVLSPVVFVDVAPIPTTGDYEAALAPLMTFDKHYPFHPTMGMTRPYLFPPKEMLALEAKKLLEYKQIPWIEMAAFLILALFIYFLRNYTYQETPEQKKARLRKTTLQRLEQLRLEEIKDYDSAYEAISNVLRSYLEGHYGIAAPKQTTREFLEEMSTSSLFDAHLQQELKALLMRADAVKFAGYNASRQECAEAERITKRVIV